jgi:hypothetical protein
MDINYTFWIMFDGLIDFTLRLSIWGGPSTKSVNPWAKKPWLANFFKKSQIGPLPNVKLKNEKKWL